jgi:type 2 lantibiotic biosynthesis protein LanM
MVVDPGTDQMRLIRDFAMLPPALNRPTLGGVPVNPLRYVESILAGFTDTYRLLLHHRDELLSADGPLRRFGDVPIRAVLRPTRHYALIHAESYHPDVLRDALERDRLLDRLWVAVPAQPELERIIAYEHADLTNGDIPLFTTRPASHDLFTSTGQRIPDYFATTGLDAAIAQIQAMSEQDLLRQQWIIKASLAALAPGRHGPLPVSLNETPPSRHAGPNADTKFPSDDACLTAAHLVAKRLATLALREHNRTSWLGLTLVHDRDWTIQPITPELYAGTLGVAFFLAYSASLTSDRDHEQLARDVIAQTASRLRDLTNEDTPTLTGSLGAFGAVGGAIYTLSHVGTLWRDHDLIDLAARLACAAATEAERDTNLDLINGIAGLVAAVHSLEQVRPSNPARDTIRRSADRLLTTAIQQNSGIAWRTPLASVQPLTGFSHGASGIATALLTAATTLDEPKYRNAALQALAYERDTFDLTHNNWPDYRILAGVQSGNDAYMWSWCHGAPGIGLARLIALQHVASPDLEGDLQTAIASTINAGFGNNDSLCHGDLGNLELLVRARELGHHGDWESVLATEAARLVERLTAGRWRCGVPGGVEIPGLMMGLAGIGYGLLRLGATVRVPSVLSLEPPRLTTRDC